MVDQHKRGDPDPDEPWWLDWHPLWGGVTPPAIVLAVIIALQWLS